MGSDLAASLLQAKPFRGVLAAFEGVVTYRSSVSGVRAASFSQEQGLSTLHLLGGKLRHASVDRSELGTAMTSNDSIETPLLRVRFPHALLSHHPVILP